MSLHISYQHFSPDVWRKLQSFNDRIIRYNPVSGEHIWETAAWDSIRSDTHGISYRVTGDSLHVQGSPARCIGTGDAVIGEGASRDLDLVGCHRPMISLLKEALEIDMSDCPNFWLPACWRLTRVDVTSNLILEDLPAVRQALQILRNCEGGRYKINQQSGETIYWSKNSKLIKGKAYSKGPHLKYLLKTKDYNGYQYTQDQLDKADRLLRLELTLPSQFWRELADRTPYKHWIKVPDILLREKWHNYFDRMIGDAEMNPQTDIKQKLIENAKTPARGKAAYGCWLLIKNEGWEMAKESFSVTTWYRHLRLLRSIGLSDSDISTGTVVPLRRDKILLAQHFTSWSQVA